MGSYCVRIVVLFVLSLSAAIPHVAAQITTRPNDYFTYHQTAIGSPPSAGTFAFREWLNNLITLRLDECPSERARTYHIAYGDPVNNVLREGTIEEPLLARTPGEIQQIIDAHIADGDVAFLLRRGDIFRVSPDDLGTIKIRTRNVTLGAYGDADQKPMLTGFVPISTITPEDGSGQLGWMRPDPVQWPQVWAITVREGVIVRHVHDYANDTLDEVFVRCNNSAEVHSAYVVRADRVLGTLVEQPVQRAFWFDDQTRTLYARTPAGTDPPPEGLEAAIAHGDPQSDASGVELSIGSDGSRIEGLRVDGFGVGHGSERNTQIYCIRLTHGRGERAAVVDCAAYFSSSHVIGDLNDQAITTYHRCVAGYARNTYGTSTGHPTVFNSYALWGGQETIFDQCRVPYGALPEHGLRSRIGRGFYLHTRGATHPPRLLIINGCEVEDNPFGCFDPWGFRDVPRPIIDAAQLDAYRVYVVDSVFRGGDSVGTGPVDRAIFINTRYENLNVVVGPGNDLGFWLFQSVSQPMAAVFINCSWSFATPFSVQGAAGHIGIIRSNYTGFQGPHLLDFVNCSISLQGANGRPLRFHDPIERDNVFLGSRTRLFNSILMHKDGGSSPPHVSPNQQPFYGPSIFPQGGISHSAFGIGGMIQPGSSGLLRGYDQAPGVVSLSIDDLEHLFDGTGQKRPTPSSSLYRAGTAQLPFPVEYDQAWNPVGPQPSIGPLQHKRCLADFNQSGDVNIEDYFAFLNAFFAAIGGSDTGQNSPADIDGDGQVTVSDYFYFISVFIAAFSGTPC